MLEGVAQGVAALEFVADFTKDFADLILDGVGAFSAALELFQIRHELIIHEVDEVRTSQRAVVVKVAFRIFWRSPFGPAEFLGDDGLIGFALQLGFHGEGFAGLGEGGGGDGAKVFVAGEGSAAAGNGLARVGDGVIAQKKPPAIGMAGGLG